MNSEIKITSDSTAGMWARYNFLKELLLYDESLKNDEQKRAIKEVILIPIFSRHRERQKVLKFIKKHFKDIITFYNNEEFFGETEEIISDDGKKIINNTPFIIFEVSLKNKKGLVEEISSYINDLQVGKNQYSSSRQKDIFKKIIWGKFNEFENNKIIVDSSDLINSQLISINPLSAIQELEKEKLLKIEDIHITTLPSPKNYGKFQFKIETNINDKLFSSSFEQKGIKEAEKILIFLNRFGDLYREPKSKYYYPMGEKEDRYKIVRHLLTNKGYQQTSQIALIFNNKSVDSIISEIGKINSISRGKLTIKDNIILGKKGSGYRMNPIYKFSLKNE